MCFLIYPLVSLMEERDQVVLEKATPVTRASQVEGWRFFLSCFSCLFSFLFASTFCRNELCHFQMPQFAMLPRARTATTRASDLEFYTEFDTRRVKRTHTSFAT